MQQMDTWPQLMVVHLGCNGKQLPTIGANAILMCVPCIFVLDEVTQSLSHSSCRNKHSWTAVILLIRIIRLCLQRNSKITKRGDNTELQY